MSIPSTLGKYAISKTLGKGGMGTVYLGFDKKLNRHVAIKTIRHDESSSGEIAAEYSRRFEIEAKAVAKLNHPNIVSVYDTGDEADTAYLVMEFVEGHDLKYYFDKKIRFSLDESLRLTIGLLEALGHAHDKGVWHRDIKPANVMIDTTGQVKLTDFGVSLIADNAERSRAGTMVGTVAYMSPEQIQGLPINNRTDIFAAGIILYQFLTHKRPFTGNDFEMQRKIINEQPDAPSLYNPELPPTLDKVVAKAMAKLPEHRYASAKEFIADIRAALGGRKEPAFDIEGTRAFYASQGSKNSLDQERASAKAPGAGSDASAQGDKLAKNPSSESHNTAKSIITSQTSPSEHAEIEFWRSIKDGTDPEEYALYLTRFPGGTYAELARRRVEKYGDPSATSAPSPVSKPKAGQRKVEPSFDMAMDDEPVENRPSDSGAKKKSKSDALKDQNIDSDYPADKSTASGKKPPAFLLPIAVLGVGGMLAGALFFTRHPAPESPKQTENNAMETKIPQSASASIGKTTAPPPKPPAPIADEPKKAEIKEAPVITKTPIATPEPAPPTVGHRPAEILARALEARNAREIQRQEQQKREEAAAAKAKENFARTTPADEASQAQAQAAAVAGKIYKCLSASTFKNDHEYPSEAEACASAKTQANAWIARWKTPAGILRGWGKFQDQDIGDCKCPTPQSCAVQVTYLAPHEGPCD